MRYRLIRALILLVMSAFVSTASAADKLRIGKAVPFAWTFTPIDVGIEAGIFARHGLELTVTGFAGDARMQQGLVSDSIDIGFGSGPGMAFMAKGVPAKAVAAMAGAPMNMSLVVLYNSPIKSLDQIKGKPVSRQDDTVKLHLLPLTREQVPLFEKDFPGGIPPYDFRKHSRFYTPDASAASFDMKYS